MPNRLIASTRTVFANRVLVSSILEIHSGFPYSPVNDMLDWVGPRNQGFYFPTFAMLDLDVEHRFTFLKFKPWIGIRAYNALNRFLADGSPEQSLRADLRTLLQLVRAAVPVSAPVQPVTRVTAASSSASALSVVPAQGSAQALLRDRWPPRFPADRAVDRRGTRNPVSRARRTAGC